MTKTAEIDPLVGASLEGETLNPSLDGGASRATGESISAPRMVGKFWEIFDKRISFEFDALFAQEISL
jgi:hypothetical protein